MSASIFEKRRRDVEAARNRTASSTAPVAQRPQRPLTAREIFAARAAQVEAVRRRDTE